MNDANASEHIEEWLDRLQDFVDGALDRKASEAVAMHLNECAHCRREHTDLLAVHAKLALTLSTEPILGNDFTSRVLARIDAEALGHTALAQRRAQLEFQQRLRAFGLDWNELLQRHLGSIVAALTVFAALAASVSSLWSRFSGPLERSLASIPGLNGIAPASLLLIAGPIAISAATLAFLRTKTR